MSNHIIQKQLIDRIYDYSVREMVNLAITIIILAISLSIDSLGVGLVYGFRKICIPLFPKLLICLFSIIYSAVALTLGKTLSNILSPEVSKLIGVVILTLMGIWIVFQALMKNQNEGVHNKNTRNKNEPLLKIAIKSLGITIQVIRNPENIDMDRSGTIDMGEALLLGFALSLDAIGVGIGSALAGFHSMLIPLAVGFSQLIFLYAGLFIGKKASAFNKINKKLFSVLPGILLISLAILRLF